MSGIDVLYTLWCRHCGKTYDSSEAMRKICPDCTVGPAEQELAWPIRKVSLDEFRAMYPGIKKRDRSRDPVTHQEAAILGRLVTGPATGLELQKWARCLNHTARISHLRKLGYDIRCKRERRADGVTIATYTLERP